MRLLHSLQYALEMTLLVCLRIPALNTSKKLKTDANAFKNEQKKIKGKHKTNEKCRFQLVISFILLLLLFLFFVCIQIRRDAHLYQHELVFEISFSRFRSLKHLMIYFIIIKIWFICSWAVGRGIIDSFMLCFISICIYYANIRVQWPSASAHSRIL